MSDNGEIPGFSDICKNVHLKTYGAGAGALAGAGAGAAIGDRVIPILGTAIGAGIGAGIGAVVGAIANRGQDMPRYEDPADINHNKRQRVVGAIAIFTYHQPQLSMSLSGPVTVAKSLSKLDVITKDEFASVEEVGSSSFKRELLLDAVRKFLEEGNYNGIKLFGEVLCKVPGNEKLGKAICDNYSYYYNKPTHTLQESSQHELIQFDDDTLMMKIYDVVREGIVELNVLCANMYGPPGAGKTCSTSLLLNEDPPSAVPVTDSTSIVCPSIRAFRDDNTCKWKRVTKPGLIERVSADLHASANLQKGGPNDNPDILLQEPKDPLPNDASENNGKLPLLEMSQDSIPHNISVETDEPSQSLISEAQGNVSIIDKQQDISTTKESLQKILRAGPKDVHVRGDWLYIVDSGGQPAFQELLPLFTRAATLSIIILNVSKPFDEELEFTYRVKGKEYPCHYKSTQLACFKSAVSSGAIFEPSSIPGVTEKPAHSMHLVLGTHIDKVPDKSFVEKQKATLQSSISSLQPYLRNRVLENRQEKSFIFPVNTLAQGEKRNDYNRQICKAMDKSDASFTVYIPIRWFVFELALPEKSIITVKEALDIGAEYGMSEEDTKLALQYLHDVTLVLYYPEVLDVIFPDPQPILKILSDLLALTYIVDDDVLDAIAINVKQREINNLKDGFFNEELLAKLNSYKSISNELALGHMIKLLLYLHIVSEVEETSTGKYFIPYALPLCTFKKPEPEVKPLLVVWKEEEDILPVPQGIFPLTIGHLLNQKERKVVVPPSTPDFYKYRDTMSLRITIKEQSHTLHIVNRYTHIEVYFTGPKEYRPEVRTLFKKAINESANAMHMKRNYIYAFACPKDKSCYCIVKESHGVVDCTLCPEPADITSKDMTYWSWFVNSSSKSGQTYNPDDLMKKVPKDADLFVVFKDYEHNFKLIGSGLDVKVAGIKYDPEDPTECLRLVFANWREKNEDVTWKKISEVCDYFPDKFGKAQSNLREHLSTKRVYEKYIDKPDFKP